MDTTSEPNDASFICYHCGNETFYSENEELHKGRELLMEMQTFGPKSKEVIIRCNNPKCRRDNKINIVYYD